MKKLEHLGKSLNKEQQRNIKGGSEEEGGNVRTGYCVGSVGCWHYYNTVSWGVCLSDVQTYCSSGSGGCSIYYSCP